MFKQTKIIIAICCILLGTSMIGQEFYQDNTEGNMQRLNHLLANSREKSWERLSYQLSKMSAAILGPNRITKSEECQFEQLWEKYLNVETERLDKKYNLTVKELSIEGTKSDFNNPLFLSEITSVKRMYDFYYYVLRKMESVDYPIYSVFWSYPLKKYISYKSYNKYIDSEKSAVVFNMIETRLKRTQNENCENTVMIMTDYLCKLKNDKTELMLENIYKQAQSEKLKKYISNKMKK